MLPHYLVRQALNKDQTDSAPPSAESAPESILACNDLDGLLEPFEPRSLDPLDLLSKDCSLVFSMPKLGTTLITVKHNQDSRHVLVHNSTIHRITISFQPLKELQVVQWPSFNKLVDLNILHGKNQSLIRARKSCAARYYSRRIHMKHSWHHLS